MRIKLYLELADTLNDIFVYLSGLEKGTEVFLIFKNRPIWLAGEIDRDLFEKFMRRSKLKFVFVAADKRILSLFKRSGFRDVLPLSKLPRSIGTIKRLVWGSSSLAKMSSGVGPTSGQHLEISAKSRFVRLRKISRSALGFSLLILFIVAGSLFLSLPKAKITITLPVESLRVSAQLVLADSQKSRQAYPGAVTGRYLEITKKASQEFQATGRKNVGEKARGQATVFNGSGKNIGLVVGTILRDASGRSFKLTRDIMVEGAKVSEAGEIIYGHTNVEVVATDSGSAWNIGSARLFFPDLGSANRELIFAESELIGGGTEETIKIVSSEDIENASQVMLEKSKNEAVAELSWGLSRGEALLPALISAEATSINSNVNVGGQTESFKLNIQSRVWTVVPLDEDVDKFVASLVRGKIDVNQRLVNEPKDTLKYQIFDVPDQGVIVADVLVEGDVTVAIDESLLRENLIGLGVPEAREYLTGFGEIVSSQIEFWPFWVKKIPSNIRFIYLYIGS